jgi:hypothetical protein
MFLVKEKMKTSEDKRMVKLHFFLNFLFGHILKESTHSFFGAWSFPLAHIWFTPSEGPKGFVNWYFGKSDHGSWTMETHHLPWSFLWSMV